MRRILLPFLLLLLALPAGAAEPALSAEDRSAIREVIAAQLDAFRRDDGEAAFGFAAPAIQHQFETAEKFMTMVRRGYRPVYRAREFDFAELREVEGQIVQRVTLVGPDGEPVEALYIMEKQPDGSWRINGCILTVSDQKST